jgi:hypothetical protein
VRRGVRIGGGSAEGSDGESMGESTGEGTRNGANKACSIGGAWQVGVLRYEIEMTSPSTFRMVALK